MNEIYAAICLFFGIWKAIKLVCMLCKFPTSYVRHWKVSSIEVFSIAVGWAGFWYFTR